VSPQWGWQSDCSGARSLCKHVVSLDCLLRPLWRRFDGLRPQLCLLSESQLSGGMADVVLLGESVSPYIIFVLCVLCLSCTVARQVAAVVGIDNVRSAIEDAQANAQLNSISNTTFVCGPAEKVMEAVLQVCVGGGAWGLCWTVASSSRHACLTLW